MAGKQQSRLRILTALAFVFAQDSAPQHYAKTELEPETAEQELVAKVCGQTSIDSIAHSLLTQQGVYAHLYPNTLYERGGIIRKHDNCLEMIEIDDPFREELFELLKMAQANNPAVFEELARHTAKRYRTFQKAGADEHTETYFHSLTETFTKASINYTGLYNRNPSLFTELSSGPITQEENDSFHWFSEQHNSGRSYEEINTENPEKTKHAQAYLIKSTFVDAEATIQTLLKAGYNFQKETAEEGALAYWHTHVDEAQPYSMPDIQFSVEHGHLFTLYPTAEGYLHVYLNKNGQLDDVTVFPK